MKFTAALCLMWFTCVLGFAETPDCDTYYPLQGGVGSILIRTNDPGYTDDGTLKWPDGTTFLLRNSGYTNDESAYYPDGSVWIVRNSGYTNDYTTQWPGGQVQQLRNEGYTNDGTIYHSNGGVWLLRDVGYTNDGQITGPPVGDVTLPTYKVSAHLIASDLSYQATTTLTGEGWYLEVSYSGDSKTIAVTECFQ